MILSLEYFKGARYLSKTSSKMEAVVCIHWPGDCFQCVSPKDHMPSPCKIGTGHDALFLSALAVARTCMACLEVLGLCSLALPCDDSALTA